MAQQSLGGLDRLSYFRAQRCMRVPERMPRNAWLFDPIARRRKHAVVEVLLAERRAARRARHQAVRKSRWLLPRVWPDSTESNIKSFPAFGRSKPKKGLFLARLMDVQ
jgi:hypothetical protein